MVICYDANWLLVGFVKNGLKRVLLIGFLNGFNSAPKAIFSVVKWYLEGPNISGF